MPDQKNAVARGRTSAHWSRVPDVGLSDLSSPGRQNTKQHKTEISALKYNVGTVPVNQVKESLSTHRYNPIMQISTHKGHTTPQCCIRLDNGGRCFKSQPYGAFHG